MELNKIKVGFDFCNFAIIEVEAKLDGLSWNKREVKLLYYATIKSIHSDSFIPPKQLDFEELKIMSGFQTIEECLEDAVKILKEMIT